MKISEILRSLADLVDVIGPDSSGESSLATQPDDIFVPPLQLKLELLKKATGVESLYSDETADKKFANSYDELSVIKKNAGMNPVVMDALADVEPLDV
jgi:hypothetical protein